MIHVKARFAIGQEVYHLDTRCNSDDDCPYCSGRGYLKGDNGRDMRCRCFAGKSRKDCWKVFGPDAISDVSLQVGRIRCADSLRVDWKEVYELNSGTDGLLPDNLFTSVRAARKEAADRNKALAEYEAQRLEFT